MNTHQAQIVRLPTACPEPVQQVRKAGRWPKAIGRYAEAAHERRMTAYRESLRLAEIERCEAARASALEYLAYFDAKLRELHAAAPRR